MKHLMDKYKGKTFAEAATLIASKYKNRDTDATQKSSYDMEIQELMRMNESVKMKDAAMQNAKQILKCGGKVKMAYGGKIKMEEGGGVPYLAGLDNILQQQKELTALNNLPVTNNSELATDNTLLTTNRAMVANPFPVNRPIATDNTVLTTNNQVTLGKNIAPVIDSSGQFKSVDSSKPDNSVAKKPNIFQRMFGENSNIYNPALAGLGVNMGLNAAILAAGYDKEAPQTNKYEADVKRLMAERSIDNTAVQNRITGAANAARQNLQNVRSANVRNAMEQNIGASQMEQAAGAELQAQQLRNQLTGEYANVLNNLGLQESQARMASRELTARNKGQFLTNLSKFGQTAAEGGKFFTTLKANDKLNELYTNVLNLKFEDFGVGTDLIKKIRNGEELSADDIVQLKNSRNSMINQFGEYYERTVGASAKSNTTTPTSGSTPTSTTSTTGGTTTTSAGGNNSTISTTGSTTQTGTPTTSTTTTPTGNTSSTTTPTNSSTSTAPTTTQTGTTNTQKTGTTNTPVSQTGTTNQPASGASTPSVSTTTPTTSTPAPNVNNTPAQSTTAKPTTTNKPVTQETPIQPGETLPNPADVQATSQKQSISLPENVSKEFDKVLDREVKFGSSTGTGLDNYGNQDLAKQLGRNPTKEEAKSWMADNVLPAVQPHFKTDTEIGKAVDFTYNTGRDVRVYMLDAYLKSKGSSFSSRSAYNVPWRQLEPSFEKSWNKYKEEIENLPESERVKLIDQGREFYYKNTFNDKGGKGTPGVDYWEKSRTNKYGKDSYYDNETGYYYKRGEDGSLSPAYGKSWSLRLK